MADDVTPYQKAETVQQQPTKILIRPTPQKLPDFINPEKTGNSMFSEEKGEMTATENTGSQLIPPIQIRAPSINPNQEEELQEFPKKEIRIQTQPEQKAFGFIPHQEKLTS